MTVHKNAFSGVHPDDLAMAYAIFRRGFHQKRFRVPQIRLRTSSGEYFWAAMDVTLRETLPDGRLFYAVYRNISQQVALSEELELQKKKNVEKTILDTIGHLPACSVLYRERKDGKLILERCSEEFLDFTGYTTGEFLNGKRIDLLRSIHPDDRDKAFREFNAKRGKRSSLRYIMFRIRIRGDGYKWVRANCSWFSFSEEKYLYIVCTDINDLKIREQKLKEQYNDAQAFLNSVSESYLMTQRADLSMNTVERVRKRVNLYHISSRRNTMHLRTRLRSCFRQKRTGSAAENCCPGSH